jgi:hypothetical protein
MPVHIRLNPTSSATADFTRLMGEVADETGAIWCDVNQKALNGRLHVRLDQAKRAKKYGWEIEKETSLNGYVIIRRFQVVSYADLVQS